MPKVEYTAEQMFGGHLFFIAQWSVASKHVPETQEAIKELAQHYRDLHPEIKSFRWLRNAFSGEPRYTYRWYEEYETMAAIEERPVKMEQGKAWREVIQYADPGTRTGTLWRAIDQDLWDDGNK